MVYEYIMLRTKCHQRHHWVTSTVALLKLPLLNPTFNVHLLEPSTVLKLTFKVNHLPFSSRSPLMGLTPTGKLPHLWKCHELKLSYQVGHVGWFWGSVTGHRGAECRNCVAWKWKQLFCSCIKTKEMKSYWIQHCDDQKWHYFNCGNSTFEWEGKRIGSNFGKVKTKLYQIM